MEFFASTIETLKVLVIALVSACGESSIFWRGTVPTTLA